jgi:hypothetical protein
MSRVSGSGASAFAPRRLGQVGTPHSTNARRTGRAPRNGSTIGPPSASTSERSRTPSQPSRRSCPQRRLRHCPWQPFPPGRSALRQGPSAGEAGAPFGRGLDEPRPSGTLGCRLAMPGCGTPRPCRVSGRRIIVHRLSRMMRGFVRRARFVRNRLRRGGNASIPRLSPAFPPHPLAPTARVGLPRQGGGGARYSAATRVSSPAAAISRRSHSGAMSKPFGHVGAPNSRKTREK